MRFSEYGKFRVPNIPRLLSYGAVLFALVMFGINCVKLFKDLKYVFPNINFEHVRNGVAFFKSSLFSNSRYISMRRHILPADKCYYWAVSLCGKKEEGDIAKECDVIRLNYYLWPARIYYLDDALMKESDIIITQSALTHMLRNQLDELAATDGKTVRFKEVFREERYSVFRREEK